MEARLTIQMGNAAFADGKTTYELSRVLNRLSEDVERVQVSSVGHMVTAVDFNGNSVGTLEIVDGDNDEKL